MVAENRELLRQRSLAHPADDGPGQVMRGRVHGLGTVANEHSGAGLRHASPGALAVISSLSALSRGERRHTPAPLHFAEHQHAHEWLQNSTYCNEQD